MSPLPRTVLAICTAAFLAPTCPTALADSGGTIEVRTVAELVAALQPTNAGRTIRIAAGDYGVKQPLTVPDGARLVGGGRMRRSADGLPLGIDPLGASVIRADAGFVGDLLQLGDRSSIEGLSIEDRTGSPGADTPRAGNVVAILSRRPRDRVRALIRDCEIRTTGHFGVGERGPAGRAVVVTTLSTGGSDPASVHTESRLALKLTNSVVRTGESSNALFAVNFAPRSTIDVHVTHSLLEGMLSAAGGTSRPTRVDGSVTRLRSRHTLYRSPETGQGVGWQLVGGGGAPHRIALDPPGADHNRLEIDSLADQIAGFRVGIQATGGRRTAGLSRESSGNDLQLELRDLRFRTVGEGAADLQLSGADSENRSGTDREFRTGEENRLLARLAGVRGSGPRANRYAHASGPQLEANRGRGNQLRISGSPAGFRRSNPGLEAPPGDEFFDAGP
jgi:hypothetical protein